MSNDFCSDVSSDSKCLQEGDKFFIKGGVASETALIDERLIDFWGYAYSYGKAALSLLDAACNNDELRDFNAIPAIFLIRHSLELHLKGLIKGLNYIKDASNDFPKKHCLLELWNEFERLCKDTEREEYCSEIMKTLITEIDRLDFCSMSFRYPIDKEGRPSIKAVGSAKKGLREICSNLDLKNLKEVFSRVMTFWEGIDTEVEIDIQVQVSSSI